MDPSMVLLNFTASTAVFNISISPGAASFSSSETVDIDFHVPWTFFSECYRAQLQANQSLVAATFPVARLRLTYTPTRAEAATKTATSVITQTSVATGIVASTSGAADAQAMTVIALIGCSRKSQRWLLEMFQHLRPSF